MKYYTGTIPLNPKLYENDYIDCLEIASIKLGDDLSFMTSNRVRKLLEMTRDDPECDPEVQSVVSVEALKRAMAGDPEMGIAGSMTTMRAGIPNQINIHHHHLQPVTHIEISGTLVDPSIFEDAYSGEIILPD